MNKGYLYLILAALCYASMGALIRVLSVDMQPLTQTFFRLIISAGLTLILALYQKKSLLLKKKTDYLLMLFMGIVGYGLQIIFYTFAIYHNTLGNTLFIFSSYPIITALLGAVILKEKLLKRTNVSMILLFAVLFLIFDPSHLSNHFVGNTLAFLTSITFAFYVICSRILSKHKNDAVVITLWSVVLAVLTSGIGAFTFEKVSFNIPPLAIGVLFLFGFFNFAAFNLVNKGFQTVKAGIGTMLLLLEPIIGSIIGMVFFRELPTPVFIVGAVEMILAIYIATFKLD